MFGFFQSLTGSSKSTVDFFGAAIELVANVTNSETLHQVAEAVKENSDIIAK